jgi:hypothetical protein
MARCWAGCERCKLHGALLGVSGAAWVLQARGVATEGISTGRIKQYPPVRKGPLQLPGGPQWQGGRQVGSWPGGRVLRS